MRDFKVKEALPKDVGRAIARIDPDDMKSLELEVGQVIGIEGKRKTTAKVMPCYADDRGKGMIQMDGITRENAKIGIDEKVTVRAVESKPARKITLVAADRRPAVWEKDQDSKYVGSLIEGLPVTAGDKVRACLFGRKTCDFLVEDSSPEGVVRNHLLHLDPHQDQGRQGREGPGVLRGHRRAGTPDPANPGDDRAAAEVPRGLRAAGHRRARRGSCCTARPARARR